MGNVIINAIGVFLLILLFIYIYNRLRPGAFDKKLQETVRKQRESLAKSDSERIGRRILVPREGLEGVKVNFYRPKSISQEILPAVFISHGGQFMDGDADLLDTYCSEMAELWECAVININYTTIDVKQIPYPQEEIRDAVLWFAIHASEFKIDPHKFVLMGFSAGAYLSVGAGTFLREKGFEPRGLIMVSPIVDDTLIRLCDAGYHMSPTVLITTPGDSMKDRYPVYIEHMKNAGVELENRVFEDALPGFVEYNTPEYSSLKQYAKLPAVNEEQKELAHICNVWIGSRLHVMTEDMA